jgi:histidine triad (HIT) family protein
VSDCIFCRIVDDDLPAEIVSSTERTVAFRDLNPQAPTHVLVIPREHIPHAGEISAAHADVVAEMFTTAAAVALGEGIAHRGYRLVFNVGEESGNSVPHLHLHILGGRRMTWPPG